MGTATTQANRKTDRTAERVATSLGDLEDMKERVVHLKEKYVDEPWTRTRDYTRTNPGKVILLSAAAGVLLGMLWRRRP
jgi:ElaB/YqjD/DUF883 family membrane-anchored ribosome-binding protein